MGRSKIEYCDNTWNPITGCMHNCFHCPEKRFTRNFSGNVRLNKRQESQYYSDGQMYVLDKEFIGERGKLSYPFAFEPTVHLYRMGRIPFKIGCRLLVGSMGEMFGKWVKESWLKEVFETCESLTQHVYMFRTEFFKRYDELLSAGILPEGENMWYGIRTEKNNEVLEVCRQRNTFLIVEDMQEQIRISENIGWLVLGAHGRKQKKDYMNPAWVSQIINDCDNFNIPVFMTSELLTVVGKNGMRRDFPEKMLQYLHEHKYDGSRRDAMMSFCNICKRPGRKSDMLSVLAGRGRGTHKTVGFICPDCTKYMEKEYGFKFSHKEESHERK